MSVASLASALRLLDYQQHHPPTPPRTPRTPHAALLPLEPEEESESDEGQPLIRRNAAAAAAAALHEQLHKVLEDEEDELDELAQHELQESGFLSRARPVDLTVSYHAFFILGACVLLPWNALIVASQYLRARLAGSMFEASFSSWLPFSYTLSNLIFLGIANSTQLKANLTHRITLSICLIGAILIGFVVSTMIVDIEPHLSFAILMVSTVALGGGASYLHGAITAVSARFGSSYLQATLSGQGGIGLAVASTQFITAYTHSRLSATDAEEAKILESSVREIRRSAFTFFLIVTSFAVIALVSHMVLMQLPLYRSIMLEASKQQQQQEELASSLLFSSPSSSQPQQQQATKPAKSSTFKQVDRKVRKLGIGIFYIFLITLSVFPSITGSVLSVSSSASPSLLSSHGGLGETLSKAELFVPLAFVIFAVGDWVGRAMPQVERLVIHDWRILSLCSFARTAFIPLFLMCNVQSGAAGAIERIPTIDSDVGFMLLMFLFSLSNGYISTLLMLAAIVEESLEPHEVPMAAALLAFYLTGGLAAGSMVSFPVRALICHCNPFLS